MRIPEHEAEKASNSYLMSLIAFVVGLPLPIVNLIATLIFYFANRNAQHFAKWHCTQALLSQLFTLCFNSVAFWWTIAILFKGTTATNEYIAYMIVIVSFNLIEFISTIYTAIQTRKGIHVQWWFFGALTDAVYKPL